jgi:hypothetical protein
MTRAEAWLVVCAAGDCGEEAGTARSSGPLRGASAPPSSPSATPSGRATAATGTTCRSPQARPQLPRSPSRPAFGPVRPRRPRHRPRRDRPRAGAKIVAGEDARTPRPRGRRARRAGARPPRPPRARAPARHLARDRPVAPRRTEEAPLAGDLPEIVADAQALIAAPASPRSSPPSPGRGGPDRRGPGARGGSTASSTGCSCTPDAVTAGGLQDQPPRAARARGGPRGHPAPDGRLSRHARGGLSRARGARGRPLDQEARLMDLPRALRHGRLAAAAGEAPSP